MLAAVRGTVARRLAAVAAVVVAGDEVSRAVESRTWWVGTAAPSATMSSAAAAAAALAMSARGRACRAPRDDLEVEIEGASETSRGIDDAVRASIADVGGRETGSGTLLSGSGAEVSCVCVGGGPAVLCCP